MSKLVELLQDTKKYDRLNNLQGGDKKFSVRNQSNVDEGIRQKNATNFIDSQEILQKEFVVDQNKNALTVQGIAKAAEADFTRYTEKALTTYETRAVDPKLSQYNSKLIQKYLATKADSQYKTINEATAGVVLVYNPA